VLVGAANGIDGFPNGLVVKLSSIGEFQWQHLYGRSNQWDFAWFHAVALASDSGLYLLGERNPQASGLVDMWLVKTDAGGNQQWTRSYGGIDSQKGYQLALVANGNILMQGESYVPGGFPDSYLVIANNNGALLADTTFFHQGTQFVEPIDVLSRTATLNFTISRIDNQFTIRQFDSSLSVQVVREYEFAGFGAADANTCEDSGFVLAGTIRGNPALIRINSNGDSLWTFLSGFDTTRVSNIRELSAGNYIVAGTIIHPDFDDDDVYLMRIIERPTFAQEPHIPILPRFYLFTFPNPFNNTTTLRLTLPETAPLTITIFDISGRQMKLVSSGVITSGTRDYLIDASTWASGTYFVQAMQRAQSQTLKIVLTK
jgi:hypothetical protein